MHLNTLLIAADLAALSTPKSSDVTRSCPSSLLRLMLDMQMLDMLYI